jgi:putative ABC transport system permease protein
MPSPRAFRQVTQRPAFSTVAILTVALTIGAASMVFSIFDAVLLRPFPFTEPERLVRVQTTVEGDTGDWRGVSYYDFDDIRRRQRSFAQLAAHATFPNQLTGQGPARAVRMTFASASFSETLQVPPKLGRFFSPEEDTLGGPVQKVVLSHALWRELFNASPQELGQTVQLRGAAYEVIGVMPAGFDYPNRTQVWVPLTARYASSVDPWWKRRDVRPHLVLGRLAPGKSLAQAEDDLQSIAAQIEREHPDQAKDAGADIITLREAEVGAVAPYVRVTAAASGGLRYSGRPSSRSRLRCRANLRYEAPVGNIRSMWNVQTSEIRNPV